MQYQMRPDKAEGDRSMSSMVHSDAQEPSEMDSRWETYGADVYLTVLNRLRRRIVAEQIVKKKN